MSTNHNFWRERRAKAVLNRGPSAYQPNALLLGQTGSLVIFIFTYSYNSHTLVIADHPWWGGGVNCIIISVCLSGHPSAVQIKAFLHFKIQSFIALRHLAKKVLWYINLYHCKTCSPNKRLDSLLKHTVSLSSLLPTLYIVSSVHVLSFCCTHTPLSLPWLNPFHPHPFFHHTHTPLSLPWLNPYHPHPFFCHSHAPLSLPWLNPFHLCSFICHTDTPLPLPWLNPFHPHPFFCHTHTPFSITQHLCFPSIHLNGEVTGMVYYFIIHATHYACGMYAGHPDMYLLRLQLALRHYGDDNLCGKTPTVWWSGQWMF